MATDDLDLFDPRRLTTACSVLFRGHVREVTKVQPVGASTAVTFAPTAGQPERQALYGPGALVKGAIR